ncbi:uncharacterized protein LOC134454580 [Engraulis encrasicolus]|uniref:uncharacterized protein LOC134454580 n=1 Tax=Engraulis encrasicolus TaxID=184585 RepID=UPI002FD64BB7
MASEQERMMVEAELLNIEEQLAILRSMQSKCQEEKSKYHEREVRGQFVTPRKKKEKIRKRPRRWDVKPENLVRPEEGEYSVVLSALQDKADEKLVDYFLLSADAFNDLANRLKPIIYHQATHRMPIHINERLAVTLRILASGESQSTVANAYKLSTGAVCGIFTEVCKALWTALQTDFLPSPTVEKWEAIKADFWQQWNFPNCVGVLDAKRVNFSPQTIHALERSEVPLLALVATCDARYRFTTMEVVTFQKESYGDLFKNSTLGSKLLNGNLDLPPPASVSEFGVSTPDLFVADAAFPLHNNLMCPFQGTDLSREEQIYNLHHSRVMRVMENTFGILVARWRFLSQQQYKPDKMTTVLKACIVLHNFLASNDDKSAPGLKYIPANFADTESMGSVQLGEWRQVVNSDDKRVFDPVCPQQFASSNGDGIDVRTTLMEYLNLAFHF